MYKLTLILLLLLFILAGRTPAADTPSIVPTPLPSVKVNAKDGAKMVLIPTGAFDMGISEQELAAWLKENPDDKLEYSTDELPRHSIMLDAYYIYQHDVTVAQYRQFCAATKRKMPAAPRWGWLDTHPMVNVNWADAKAYADWAGAALPTEAQWEKAARGTDGRRYPWGNAWDAAKCSNSVGANHPQQTAPVGSFPTGASAYGCLDMAGNVWQWCADWYAEDYYQHSPTRNPTGPNTGTTRVMRGGSWYGNYKGVYLCMSRGDNSPNTVSDIIGFRCVIEIPT